MHLRGEENVPEVTRPRGKGRLTGGGFNSELKTSIWRDGRHTGMPADMGEGFDFSSSLTTWQKCGEELSAPLRTWLQSVPS
jgi:hypothetical protein